ncbi:DUF6484 domain-containing protein [uncultured Desulfobacter sp.]|uniref:DUF6484 domain-containing protein n=1 Tax=uncultured Desulfobacter sp. TaxID=240139 RepID=UPI0029C78FFA|nr:DUF6484 domain-containing protein [uncultured Desulfobacter sp.]
MNVSAVKKISELPTAQDLEGVQTGKIVKIDQKGNVFVDFPGNRKEAVQARITAAAAGSITRRPDDSDIQVLIAFEENDIHRPVIIDVVCDRIEAAAPAVTMERNHLDDVKIDGETVTFDAKKEIVLRCGKSSIRLTRAGKVIIRGAYLLNRSSGVNRIKGGSVQIN